MDRAEIERLLASRNETAIADALLSAAYYEPDWQWVQGQCLHFLNDPENNNRWIAAVCLGHLARIHRKLDLEVVLPKLQVLKDDPAVGSAVEDALADIRFYLVQ